MGTKRIGVLTGGGDCPGLNPTIGAIVRKALKENVQVTGIKNGWKGLIEKDTVELDLNSVSGILPKGGTILGTSRTNPYKEKGDLANWMTAQENLGAIGGSMDLVCRTKRIMVMMRHVMPSGEPRIVNQCSYPLTGKKVVNTILTDLALIDVTEKGLLLKEVAPGVSVADIQTVTEPELIVGPDLKEMEF